MIMMDYFYFKFFGVVSKHTRATRIATDTDDSELLSTSHMPPYYYEPVCIHPQNTGTLFVSYKSITSCYTRYTD